MLSIEENSTVKDLSNALATWSHGCSAISKKSKITLSGLDHSNTDKTIDDLFFANLPGHVSLSEKASNELQAYEVVDSGTLRNSFYIAPFLSHTDIQRCFLRIKVTGRCVVQLSKSRVGEKVGVICEKQLSPPKNHDGNTPYIAEVPFVLGKEVARSARLFWRLRALEDGVQIHEVSWCASAPKTVEGKMLVAMRTFGRTADIINLLENFATHAETNEHYDQMLKNTFFFVLDTTNGVDETSYEQLSQYDNLNYQVVRGANLGGGGNMSQLMRLVNEASVDSGVEPQEFLLLDDDLSISLEALYRHWAATLFRTDTTIFTLPVFMKTEPRRMWEDGAFWGRFIDSKHGSDRTHVAPRLLRHGLVFNMFDNLDSLAEPNYPEYCTFIFFSLPWKLFQSIGYPLAIFLRGDDIEYSLRSYAMTGSKIMSNPNLLAWHEPAHSYAQEYMSICHGVIINMCYEQEKPNALVEFFLNQALRHASIRDINALKLYVEILRDLMSKSVFLENGFATHYIAKLKFFKDFDTGFRQLTHEIINDLRASHSDQMGVLAEHPFLYPNIENRPNIRTVILHNPHSKSYFIYPFDDIERTKEVSQILSELYALINEFSNRYEELRLHYISRVNRSSTAEFWDKELSMHDTPATLAHNN